MDLGSTPSNESCRLIVWARPKGAGVYNDSYFLSNSSAREVVFSDRLQRGCPKTRNPSALVPQEAVRELLGDGEVARALVFLHRSKKVVGGTAHFLLVPLRNYSWTFCPPRAMKVASSPCGLDRRLREFTTTYSYFLSNRSSAPDRRAARPRGFAQLPPSTRALILASPFSKSGPAMPSMSRPM